MTDEVKFVPLVILKGTVVNHLIRFAYIRKKDMEFIEASEFFGIIEKHILEARKVHRFAELLVQDICTEIDGKYDGLRGYYMYFASLEGCPSDVAIIKGEVTEDLDLKMEMLDLIKMSLMGAK